MSITPTVMIAAAGLLAGSGIGTNTNMTTSISSALGNPLITAYNNVLNNANIGTVSGLSTTLSSLPSAFTTTNAVATAVPAQAAKMAPSVGTFITLHSGATAFGSASMDYGAALSSFGSKSFGDLGIGVKGFTDANSGGLTSLLPGFGALAASAKNNAFGSIGATLDPVALAKGQASAASSALGDSMKSVGTGLKNYGTLMDFSNPQTLGYQGMYANLQKQGLTSSNGIDDAVSAAGSDPKVPSVVPDTVLKGIFTSVTGSDLGKIISQTGAKPSGNPQSLNDLLDPSIMMPAGAVAALGVSPGAGVEGLKSVGNTMTNIGVPMDNMTAASLMGGIQTKVGSYLAGLTSLVPQSVKGALGPMLGAGNSPFGTPQMNDMLGSLSGVHTPQFETINTQFNNISGSSVGQALTTALQNMNTALQSNYGTDVAYTNLQAAVTSFNAQASSNSQLSSALSSISQSTSAINAQISKETSNFSLAGINLSSPPTNPTGSGQILSFASKLHGFGVDKQQLGHNDVFNGAATDDLTGDALKASLLEGKNVAAMQGVGKTPPAVSNTAQALGDANDSNIDSFISDFQKALATRNQAVTAANAAKEAFLDVNSRYQANKGDAGLSAQWDSAKAELVAVLQTQVTAVDAFDQSRNTLTSAADTASNATKAKVSTILQEAIDSYVPIIKLRK